MSWLRRGYRKASIELGNVVLSQKLIGPRHTLNPPEAKFLRQSSLPGPEIPFPSSARLRRVRRNHLDPQLGQRPAHLRWALAIRGLAGLRGIEEMARAIAVQRAESAFSLDHLP